LKAANLFIVFLFIKDALTGLRSAKEQLKIKGEFEELGFFAASIEHELRNPLQVIGDEVDYLKGKTQSNPELQSRFAILERQITRMSVAADIINVLRSKREDIVRKMKPVLVLNHVNQAIKYVKKELSQQSANIFFTVEERTNQLFVEADPSLLEQCFVNLLKNSVEALNRSKKSGEIVIELFLRDKGVAAINFRDNGTGFVVEDIPKLIDPTYTKKPVSTVKSNRGLGLFVCDRIVQLHGGQISFSNHKNGGAIVMLEFPRYITKKMQREISA
jgi:two-component system C4-dicarboxylate transport sensor histidine kinase DctB